MRSKPQKKRQDQFIRWLIVSDLHGPYLDEEAYGIFLQVAKEHFHDQVVILGDLLDAQRVSSHPQRFEIMNPVKPRSMDFHEEVDYTIEKILKPLRKAKPKTPIMFIPGNHERRVIRALRGGGPALEQIYEASARSGRSVHLDDLLRFDDFEIKLEFGEDNYGVYFLRHRGARVAMLHGYKTNKTRMKSYLDYFQCHVLSGHTHRDDYVVQQIYGGGTMIGCETMCMRTIRGIEYLDEGHDPGWTTGFVTVWIDRNTGETYIKQHKIKNRRLEFHGTIYTA